MMRLFELIVKSSPKFTPEERFPEPAQKLIKGLLNKSANHRTGYEQIKSGKPGTYFEGFSWEALAAGKIRPPFVPQLHPRLPQQR